MILPLLTLELHYICHVEDKFASPFSHARPDAGWNASIVNVCVYDTCCSKSLLCWTILSSDDDRLTLAKFYETASN